MLLAAHLSAQAQVHLFSFAERGRSFSTAAHLWQPTPSADRTRVGDASRGSAYLRPRSQFTMVHMGGQYMLRGIALGYSIGAGCTPKVDDTPGNDFTYRTRDYAGDAQLSLGVVALRAGGLCVVPTFGMGYGVWASHYQARSTAQASTRHEDQEEGLWSQHIVQDANLLLLYTLPYRESSGPRLSFSLRAGYKAYRPSAALRTMTETLPGQYDMRMAGGYVQLGIGTGLVRTQPKR